MNIDSFSVSVIIPMKNEEGNIGNCLESLFKNKIKGIPLEVIVVDNGSEDNSLTVAKKYPVKILQKIGCNVSTLRNYGASLATGSILAFLDADCEVKQDWIKRALSHFDDDNVACVGATPIAPVNGTWVQKSWSSFRTRRSHIRYVEWLNSSNFIVRKKVYEKVGGFSEKLETCEDVDLSYKIGSLYKLVFDPGLVVVHYGEPKTILEFFKKEIWRGKSSFLGVFEHGIRFAELRSLLLPFYYIFSIVYIMYSLMFSHNMVFYAIFVWLLPGFFFAGYYGSFFNIALFLRMTTLFLLYAHARLASFIRTISALLYKMMRQNSDSESV